MNNKKILAVIFFLIIASVLTIQAQSNLVSGSLNTWTDKKVARTEVHNGDEEATQFVKVRAGKNKGFDRVVFEFKKNLPNFNLEYQKPPFAMPGEEVLKISGKAFIHIEFFSVSYPEDAKFPFENLKILKNQINLPVVNEIKNDEWFEGYLGFVIGLKAKKLYRVQQLSNPARLVIDFKN